MTEIVLVCSKEGCFRACNARGHAGFAARGKDIVCASETTILRTALDVLEKTGTLKVKADAPSRGQLAFIVEEGESLARERLICVADFIRCGLKTLSDEYPGNIHLREIIEE
ncbi:MAG: ribosomal-processing cysteine protease Prp [Treponema sp.]|nr:ribosomal-processing cysteine protease Prp [Treponema sp.]